MHLRNEINFGEVHGIMNTSGLLQSKLSPSGFPLTLQDTRKGLHVKFARGPQYT